jgi:hypothetical protein
MAKLTELFKWEHPQYTTFDGFLAGVECEIEAVRGLRDEVEHFRVEHDGSLRNNGFEYISEPMTRDMLVPQFKRLHASIMYTDKSVAFSPRTSTHVHVNCRTLTTEQLKTLMLLYALFEEVFFAMVDPVRRNNIHCVPLTETYLPGRYRQEMRQIIKNWHKYTAFNLLPIMSQGTVEFRHLQGTDDAELLDEWLTCIQNLWELSQATEITRDNIVNPRAIDAWYHDIFSHSPRAMALEGSVPNMIKNSLIDVKFALL